jgi:hypothetical protein
LELEIVRKAVLIPADLLVEALGRDAVQLGQIHIEDDLLAAR